MNPTDLLKLLQPPGVYSPDNALLQALQSAEGKVLDQAGFDALYTEMDPRTVDSMLLDWEIMAGLPDPCVDAGQTKEARRMALLAKLINLGGQSIAYYINLAAALGYTITVTEGPAAHVWTIHTSLDNYWEFTVTDSAADPLAYWGNQILECVINRLKPAHTRVIYSYT